MNIERSQYIQWTAGIFAVIALGHAWRLLAGWSVVVANRPVPLWVNVVGVVIAGYFAYQGWRLNR